MTFRVLVVWLLAALIAAAQNAADVVGVKSVTWDAVQPLHARLEATGQSSATFAAFVEQTHTANVQRVREGDLDHLVFYLLQSTHFTSLPPIEPALSAKALVEGLDAAERQAFLSSGQASAKRVPPPVQARTSALLRALGSTTRDARLIYFRELVDTVFPDPRERQAGLNREYLRAMRFVYEKEFIAQRSPDAADAVVALYRKRGLSTDTAVEAGYLVSLGLGVLRSLEPTRVVHRVLIVGPGLDLAPRTALLESGPPESYQPWAIVDALLALGLSRAGELEVVAGDINPRVVEHIRRSQREPPTLRLLTGIGDDGAVTLTSDYRDYFTRLGRSIGDEGSLGGVPPGHLGKTVRVGTAAARTLSAETLDIVTQRLTGRPFDLVVATNMLPYFDDVQLMLAMANVASMLAPGGAFLHNESRPVLGAIATSVGLPLEQSRHVAIATVRGAPPLADSVWLHRKVSDLRR